VRVHATSMRRPFTAFGGARAAPQGRLGRPARTNRSIVQVRGDPLERVLQLGRYEHAESGACSGDGGHLLDDDARASGGAASARVYGPHEAGDVWPGLRSGLGLAWPWRSALGRVAVPARFGGFRDARRGRFAIAARG